VAPVVTVVEVTEAVVVTAAVDADVAVAVEVRRATRRSGSQ